jgi:hypothetical protein
MGMRPKRVRTWVACPHCHRDLDELAPKELGDLYADPQGDTFWKGRDVKLNATLRIILNTLIVGNSHHSRRDRDGGIFASVLHIAERADIGVESVKVMVSALRGAFRQVDPEFDHIEAGSNEWRWSETKVRRPLANSQKLRLTVYDNGEADWRGYHRVFLSEQEAKALAMIIKAAGRPVTASELAKATSTGTLRMGYAVVGRVRKKFAEVDPNIQIIGSLPKPSRHNKGGFYLALPEEMKKAA